MTNCLNHFNVDISLSGLYKWGVYFICVYTHLTIQKDWSIHLFFFPHFNSSPVLSFSTYQIPVLIFCQLNSLSGLLPWCAKVLLCPSFENLDLNNDSLNIGVF